MAFKSVHGFGLSNLSGAFGISKLTASRSQKSLLDVISACFVTMLCLIIFNLEETHLLILAALAATFALRNVSVEGGFGEWLPLRSFGSSPGQSEVRVVGQRHPLRTSRSSAQHLDIAPSAEDVPDRGVRGSYEKVTQIRVASQPAMPRQPLKFQATSFEAEVQELMAQISRKPEGEQIAKEIVELVSERLRPQIPVAAIVTYVSGNCLIPSEFATFCPQMHVAMYVDIWKSRRPTCVNKVQKALIKSCTDTLVDHSGFKFRRSAYGIDDPLVSLLTPPLSACAAQSIVIDFSVNSATQLYLHNLVSICGGLDHRAESMILLVRRWAQDRGIAHTTAGHLSDYAWALLTVFFLQVAPGSDSVLPPITCASEFEARQSEFEAQQTAPAKGGALKSTAELFQEFIAFYAKDFKWEKEAVSVRLARRGPQIPRHFVFHEGKEEVAPTIEDPFDLTRTLSIDKKSCIDSLHKEFGRAYKLCARKASLSELLEPWTAA
eukprot:CAMPEP_0170591046 /NCGR_PEP_ID=MMETSP0224-20130122/12192_1 /TAXON_ID=285029 /ORGANISM="Togula jolla, Strain CCCM 725" /LENGTH=492 /DNA_ID=CAMNT_0010914879 /DNA_START=75 /DNA_END=1553 /DNA_ORIENTATION=-